MSLRSLTAVLVGGAVLAGCSVPQSPGGSWEDKPSVGPAREPQPRIPGERADSGIGGRTGDRSQSNKIKPPEGCKDFDPAVLATCLDQVTAVTAMPGGESALAGERTTGRVLIVVPDQPVKLLTTLGVEATGDGGLTALIRSGSYEQDKIVYAYITTGEDNRVVRFVPGDTPKPVLTGIPKGATHNRGALALDKDGSLLVATGDAGNPAAVADPASLAGKVLRVDGFGKPAADNPLPGNPVLASGLQSPGGLCHTPETNVTWVTDGGEREALYRITPGKPLGAPAWNWTDKPGLGGCAAWGDLIMITSVNTNSILSLPVQPDGSFGGQPNPYLKDVYGRLAPLERLSKDSALAGTVNKGAEKKVSSDDRVVVIQRDKNPSGGID
ncbi:glucose dehydrogenase [Pseudonocardiaceae bacterium YIM PH 21723]|nr:glucose dehydrogenase [Pseudonocardiaceae bacterium YIM PH 21723]